MTVTQCATEIGEEGAVNGPACSHRTSERQRGKEQAEEEGVSNGEPACLLIRADRSVESGASSKESGCAVRLEGS